MAQQTINVGTAPNDGTGTPLRTAFQYTNSNFSELYTAVGPSGNNIVVPGTATISGDLTVDTSTLKVDSANNFVGVGTTTGVNLAAGRGNLTIGGSSSAILNLSIGAADTGYVIHDGTSISLVNRIAAGSLIFSTNSTERFRIDSSGNVGIGVTPSAWAAFKAIDIGTGSSISGASSTTALGFNNYWNGSSYIYKLTAAAGDYRQTALGHAWYTAPSGTAGNAITFTQAMTLDASGNLLVGTTTNTDNFKTNIQFSGTSTNGLLVKNLASSGAPLLFQLIDSAQSLNTATPSAEYQDSTTQRWRLYKNGGLANYQANNVNLSDVRTKTDIKPLGSYWNKIKSLEVVTFKYKDQSHSDDNIGLIAQQVESVAPELVDADGFGNTPDDGVPLKTIYTTDLYHAAIKALQEAMVRIEVLESKLA